jgi:hypothetical protein
MARLAIRTLALHRVLLEKVAAHVEDVFYRYFAAKLATRFTTFELAGGCIRAGTHGITASNRAIANAPPADKSANLHPILKFIGIHNT